MKYLATLFLFLLLSPCSWAQMEITQIETHDEYLMQSKPKLVVGIVIDQMRYDYLYRFENLYKIF